MRLRPRMEPPVHITEPISRDMRINLGGADVSVPQQLLDDSQVSAMFQQVGGETVTQHVRRNVP